MTHTKTYLRIGTLIFLSVLVAGSAFAGITESQPYGYNTNPYGYGGYGGGYYGSMNGCGTQMPYGIAPYPQQPTSYCMQWNAPRLVPVNVMVPGKWERQWVWIPGRQITLYDRVPGYWQRTNMDGTPAFSVYPTPNGWYARPYNSQARDGYFDATGVWHEK